ALNIMSAGELYFIDNPNASSVDLDVLKDKDFVDDVGSFSGNEAYDKTVIVTKATTGASAASAMFEGAGTTSKIQVVFEDATKDAISKYANSDRGEVTAAPGITAGAVSSQ